MGVYAERFRQLGEPEVASDLRVRWDSQKSKARDKAMRWLGFAQGWACAKGIFTLDQVREHTTSEINRP